MKVQLKKSKKISYCITVCNEHLELDNLLSQLLVSSDREISQVLVQGDGGNVTKKVKKVIKKYREDFKHDNIDFDYIEYPLNNDFSAFKNNLALYAKGDWIFQIDADEKLSANLTNHLLEFIDANSDVDVIAMSRINIVHDIDVEHIDKWRWNITTLEGRVTNLVRKEMSDAHYDFIKSAEMIISEDDGWVFYKTPIINWPDHQMRLYKNVPNIKWVNKVHEVLEGYKHLGYSAVPDWSLIHIKDLDKQVNQNEFYSNMKV